METIPEMFEERVHNLEFYAQKQIYNRIKLLNKLPIVQNVAGEFTNYAGDSNPDDVKGDVITTGDGLDFNEISFGEPSIYRGATVPKGFMFKMNSRLEDKGRLEATLQVFMNKSIGKLANFYDKVYMDALAAGAGITNVTGLKNITGSSTGIDVIENELKIINAMESINDVDTGFTPTTVFLPRADKLAIDIALAKSDLLDDSNFEYIGTNSIAAGKKVIMDLNTPTCTIEKYADPKYSIISQWESETDTGRVYTESGDVLPQSFINVKMTEPNEPQRSYVYLFAESGLNILEPNGIMYI